MAQARNDIGMKASIAAVERLRNDARSHAARRLAAILDVADDAIVATAADGRITFVNGVAARLFGYPPGDVLGWPVSSLLDKPMRDIDVRRLSGLLATASHRRRERGFDVRVLRRNGEPVPVRVRLVALAEDPEWAYVVVARDLSEERARFADLALDLHRSRTRIRRLEAINRFHSTTLHAVAHEIAHPLSVVRGLAGLLLDEAEGRLELARDVRVAALGRVRDAASRMSELLEGFVGIERAAAEEGTVTRQPLDVAHVVRRALEPLDDVPRERLVFDTDPVVVPIDPVQVETIVRNLVRNAVRYSPSGSPIKVEVRNHRGAAVLKVEDAGPGVPRRFRRRIFEPFRRGPAAPRDGLGIGLSLVARFAAAHGGRAWVSDAEAGGAAFFVLLPGDRGRSGTRRAR